MNSKTAYLRDLRRDLINYKGEILRNYYYLESSDLHYKVNARQWSVIEVFEHLNIINFHYLKLLGKGLSKAKLTERDTFRSGKLGQFLIKHTKPHAGKITFPIPSFKNTNPVYRQKKGHKLVDHVVFQDFTEGIDQLISLLEKAEDKELDVIKIPVFLPFLRLNLGDAFGFVCAHIERHLLQAGKTMDMEVIGNGK